MVQPIHVNDALRTQQQSSEKEFLNACVERPSLTEDRIYQSQLPLVEGRESELVNTFVRTQTKMK